MNALRYRARATQRVPKRTGVRGLQLVGQSILLLPLKTTTKMLGNIAEPIDLRVADPESVRPKISIPLPHRLSRLKPLPESALPLYLFRCEIRPALGPISLRTLVPQYARGIGPSRAPGG